MWTLCQCLSGQSMDLVTSVSDAVKTESLLTPGSTVERKETTRASRLRHSPAASIGSRKRTGVVVLTSCSINKRRKENNETNESGSDTEGYFLLREYVKYDYSASSEHPRQVFLSKADSLNAKDSLARAMECLFSESENLVRKAPRFRPSASELRDPLPVIKMNMEQELDYTEIEALPEREQHYYMSLAMEQQTWMRLENNEWMQMIERSVEEMELGSLSDASDTSDMEDTREEGGDGTRAS